MGTEKKKINVASKNRKQIMGTIMVVMIFASIYCFFSSIGVGASALGESYNDSYNTKKEQVYQKKYDEYKDKAEEKFHVSNSVSIYIDSLQEEQKLEVLEVSDVEYIIEEENNAWLEVPGTGTYVVNLKAAEFVIDNERAHVLVRVPNPEITNIEIDMENVKKLHYTNGILNGNYEEGAKQAKEMYSQADALIKAELTSNQNFYISAQNAAKSNIEALVKKLNPNVENLTVDVEFYE
jgi:peroxiredoxin